MMLLLFSLSVHQSQIILCSVSLLWEVMYTFAGAEPFLTARHCRQMLNQLSTMPSPMALRAHSHTGSPQATDGGWGKTDQHRLVVLLKFVYNNISLYILWSLRIELRGLYFISKLICVYFTS
jgi:hypothetical protein